MKTISRLFSSETTRIKAEKLFSGGAFIRKGADIPAYMKARLSWIIFKEFVLTKDPERRKLFIFIFQLIRTKKIAIDKGFGFLLSMLSCYRQIADHQKHMDEYRKMVMQYTSEPWNTRTSKS
jgi:hypothetical protein